MRLPTERFIVRNRAGINRALAEGYRSLSRGEGKEIRTPEELFSALEAEKARRKT
jgi:hypothetical protein